MDELLEAVRLEEVAHERYLKTQEALIKASLHAACPSEAAKPKEDTESIALRKLIDERKSLAKSESGRRCQLSKDIRREVKRLKAEKRATKINAILTNFAKLGNIKAIKKRKKMDLTVGMIDTDEVLKHDKMTIVEVFAKFYEQLYSSRSTTSSNASLQKKDVITSVPKFNDKDLEDGLRSLKSGKAKDGKGFLAEMLRVKSEKLKEVLLELLNAVLDVDAPTPAEWHENVLKIVFKGGDAKQANNYRPICVIPVLYKLFVTMLHKRLTPTLEAALTKEQAGFRKNFSTVDHLHTLMQIQEKTHEWQIPLWICFIDFEKAFDSIEHHAIWGALQRQGVSDGYIELLQRLYAGQTSQVLVDSMLSRKFEVQRGTKQGDPLSTLLFNAVLEDIFREIRPRWTSKRYGLEMSVGSTRHLSNLCFADDVVLFAKSLHEIKEMLTDLKKAALARGLKVHSGKTKVLTNEIEVRSRNIPRHIDIDGEQYEVLAADGYTKYLGRKVSFVDSHATEFDNRIAAAWGAFSKHKAELTDRQYRLKDRRWLFDAVVTPTVLYGCETWALKVDQERRLKATQRKMLRMTLGARRRILATSEDDSSAEAQAEDDEEHEILEPWPDFLKRMAKETDEHLEKSGIPSWMAKWRTKKWRWAQKLYAGNAQKWSQVATSWKPLLHSVNATIRKRARPRKRWEDDIKNAVKTALPEETRSWQELAKDVQRWRQTEEFFVEGQ